MRSTLPLLTTLPLTLGASSLKNFRIPSMSTHQPNGNPAGETNFYNIAFDVSSSNSGTSMSASCGTFWGDNSWLDGEAYSVYVPTGEWISCDSTSSPSEEDAGADGGDSPFAFKLFPYFSVGNFSVEVKETLPSGTILYGEYHFHNKTSWYTCDITPTQTQYESHAYGDCKVPDGQGPIEVQVHQTELTWVA